MICSTLTLPRVPVYDAEWSSTSICVWDAAAAHLLLEDAIRRIPDEAAGQAFLITGNGPPWSCRDTRNTIKVGIVRAPYSTGTDNHKVLRAQGHHLG